MKTLELLLSISLNLNTENWKLKAPLDISIISYTSFKLDWASYLISSDEMTILTIKCLISLMRTSLDKVTFDLCQKLIRKQESREVKQE